MYVASYQNHQVYLTDSATGQVVRILSAEPGTAQVDGDEVAIPDGNGKTQVWDIKSGQVIRTL